jgi:hypothetical protein
VSCTTICYRAGLSWDPLSVLFIKGGMLYRIHQVHSSSTPVFRQLEGGGGETSVQPHDRVSPPHRICRFRSALLGQERIPCDFISQNPISQIIKGPKLMKVTHFMIVWLEDGERLAGIHAGAINRGLSIVLECLKEARRHKTNIMVVERHSRIPLILGRHDCRCPALGTKAVRFIRNGRGFVAETQSFRQSGGTSKYISSPRSL